MSQQPDAEFIALQAALEGEYSLDRELGRGGMGIVYLAREVRLARPVAIKVLPPALAARATKVSVQFAAGEPTPAKQPSRFLSSLGQRAWSTPRPKMSPACIESREPAPARVLFGPQPFVALPATPATGNK